MKSIKLIATTAMIVASLSASAQFTNGGTKPMGTSAADTEGWSSVWFEWNPSTLKYDVKDADNQSFTGLSFGYSQAFNVMAGQPLFVEAGFGVQYSFYKESEEVPYYDYYYGYDTESTEQKFSMFSAKIPVNLIYKYDIPNSTVSLMPHAGLTLRYNLSAKLEVSLDEYDDESYDLNLFDEDDMDGSKNTWNRLQLGWQIGVKARIGQSFLVGLSYGSDLSEIAKKTKIATTTISVGYAF